MNTIKVIFVEPGKFAEVREIPASMETFKSILTCKPVSGQIKQIYPFEDEVAIVIDEDEKFNNTAPNRALIIDHRIRDILYGTFLVCGLGEENYESLSPELSCSASGWVLNGVEPISVASFIMTHALRII